jgi:hypothetical protein
MSLQIAVGNDTTAVTPTVWSTMVQQPLYKQLVALKVCRTKLADSLQNGKAIQVPRFADLSARVYTPGTDISATVQDWKTDTINVSTKKYAAYYVDDVEQLQANVAIGTSLAGEAGYQLSNAIDTFAFTKITAGGASQALSAVDRDDAYSDSSTGAITASTATIIPLFAGMRKKLRENNVEENRGDWACVVTPRIASFIEEKAAGTGYSLADSTLRNGYAGDFMGFQVYVSNNLPSGVISATAPSTIGGPSAAGSATSGYSHYFGRKGAIDLILQRAPAVEIRQPSDKIGVVWRAWTVYGAGIVEKNRGRAFGVPIVGT